MTGEPQGGRPAVGGDADTAAEARVGEGAPEAGGADAGWRTPPLREDLAIAGRATFVVGAVLAVVAGWGLAGEGWDVAVAGAYLTLVGTVLTVIDWRTHRLPDRIVLAGTVGVLLVLVTAAATGDAWAVLGRAVAAALVSLVGYFVLALLRSGGLGLGDVKLGGLLGLWLGWFGWAHVLTGVLAAFVLGGVIALVLLVTRRASRGSAIAFGPWMVLGAAVTTVLAVAEVPLGG
ncbi:prepilin peptidase [Georgenia ruanii]|uniref:Prepilin peptidase n=1 Tax=Georgenia ruanii TaxID=348442 RepID=A0A7J9UVW4_9MICO|nr:A24 family peptidase [Georgenia ruanii]MPV88738.1 prepilin peptidase [Georgenia ruanii]